MKLVAAFMLSTALATPAFAEVTPRAGTADPRVRTVTYDPSNVTTIVAAPNRSTVIEFAPDETIHSFSLGDEDAWTFAPDGSRAFIAPEPAMSRNSNVHVVTSRPDGSTRLYYFDLVIGSSPGSSMAGVHFLYPGDAAAATAIKAKAAAAEAETRRINARLAVDVFYGVRNWRYLARGDRDSEPSEASDNGRQTVFRFPGNRRTPSIYTGKCGTKAAVAPVLAKDDLIVVETTSEYFCLRLGQSVTELHNVGYDAVGFDPGTGTSSPEVVRTIKARAVRPVR